MWPSTTTRVQGNSLLGEARVLFRQGDNQSALKAYRAARGQFVAVGDRLGQGGTIVGEASILFRQGDNQGALVAYRTARGHFVAVGDRLGQGTTWEGEATVLFLLGDNQGALVAYRTARGHFVAVGDRSAQSHSLLGEARVLFQQGDLQGALGANRVARGHFVAVGNQLGQGNSFLIEADVLFRLGDLQGAQGAYRAARGHFAAVGSRRYQGVSLFGEGRVLFLQGAKQGALGAYRTARRHFVAVGDHLGQGNTFIGEADLLFLLGDIHGALGAYRAARGHFVVVGAQLGQGACWEGEARVLSRLGDNPGAVMAARNSVRFAKKVGAIPNEYIARMVLMQALAALGRDDEASEEALSALRLVKRWRARGSSDVDRAARANLSDPYDFLIPHLAETPEGLSRGFDLAEDAHAPVLLDLLVTDIGQTHSMDRRVLLRERVRIHKERAGIQTALSRTLDPSARFSLAIQRNALDRELGLIELATLGTLKNRTGQRISARERRMLARSVGPIVLYYVAPEETLAFLLQPGRRPLRVVRIPAWRWQLRAEVRALRHDLGNPLWQKRANQRARTLFNQLVGPIADQLAGSSRLTIIPHGPLHQLPFEALLDPNGKRVFERWDVTVAPSLSVLHHVRKQETARRRKSKAAPFIALAAGQGLHFPDREVQDIAAIFGRDQATFRQGDATFATYQKHAARARHLLISTHGVHVPNSRTGTYLELTPTTEHDHRLTAGEIAQIPLRAELVTLAACSTAQGEAMLSDERLDLTRALLIAGARAVLATRWKVPESNATRQFLIDFYRALRTGGPEGKGMRKDAALSHARHLSMKRGDDAQLWAAWILVGDGR